MGFVYICNCVYVVMNACICICVCVCMYVRSYICV